jgi:hypothetical protein
MTCPYCHRWSMLSLCDSCMKQFIRLRMDETSLLIGWRRFNPNSMFCALISEEKSIWNHFTTTTEN